MYTCMCTYTYMYMHIYSAYIPVPSSILRFTLFAAFLGPSDTSALVSWFHVACPLLIQILAISGSDCPVECIKLSILSGDKFKYEPIIIKLEACYLGTIIL